MISGPTPIPLLWWHPPQLPMFLTGPLLHQTLLQVLPCLQLLPPMTAPLCSLANLLMELFKQSLPLLPCLRPMPPMTAPLTLRCRFPTLAGTSGRNSDVPLKFLPFRSILASDGITAEDKSTGAVCPYDLILLVASDLPINKGPRPRPRAYII